MSERKEEREERKKELPYIYKYIKSINQPTNQHKISRCISVDESLHDVIKLLAPFFNYSISDFYADAALEKLEALIPKLPENIQLNVVRQLTVKQRADPEILGARIDLIAQDLRYAIERIRRAPESSFNVKLLRTQLDQAFRLASTSGDESLKRLVFEAKELLRRPAPAEGVRAPAKREKPFDYSVYRPYSLDELRAQHQALKEQHQRGLIPDETFLLKSQPLAFEISRREHKLKEGS